MTHATSKQKQCKSHHAKKYSRLFAEIKINESTIIADGLINVNKNCYCQIGSVKDPGGHVVN